MNFPGMHPEALRGTPDLNLSLNQRSLHFYTLPHSAEVRVPARPGCWNKRCVGRWRNLGAGPCGGPLYRRCLCDLIPHFRHANKGLKPTLAALLFILQCTARMRQGTESSQHVRCWLTVGTMAEGQGFHHRLTGTAPSSAGTQLFLPVWQGWAAGRPMGGPGVPRTGGEGEKDWEE